MKQTRILLMMTLALVLSNAVVSCKKDPATVVEEAKVSKQTIENPELATKLKALGFQVEGGVITIDDKVMNTTSLDLSGAKISNLEGLELFPKLEEVNLADNNFGDTFDFAQLPKTVTGVNLADNDIYIYKGLATVSDKGFVLQKDLKKLVLPASARFNVDLLPDYYKETKGKTTLQMQNPDTQKIEDYTTLRNIPDENLRNFFKENFSSIMTENGQMDLGKTLSGEDAQKPFLSPHIKPQPKNWEGIEYLLNRLDYETPRLAMLLRVENPYKLKTPYLRINEKVQIITFTNFDIENFDMSEARNVFIVIILNSPSLETIDLRNSKKFMINTPLEGLDQEIGGRIDIGYCDNLKEIKLSEEIKPTTLYSVQLLNLPNLTTFDMSKMTGLSDLALVNLPNLNINDMPQLQYFSDKNKTLDFAVDAKLIENPKVREFVIKYGKERHFRRLHSLYWGRSGRKDIDGGNLMEYKLFNFTKLY